MPIKGLSDQLRFPRLGKIHLGVKVKNPQGVEYPKAVDYFVCEAPAFQKVYPGQPHVLDVCFPTEKVEHFASQYYRAYSQSRGLICKGDGENCQRLIDASTGDTALITAEAKKTEWASLPCPGRECPYYGEKRCREIMFLQVFLPKVEGLGIWQIDTSSVNAIRNLNSVVELLRRFNGHVSGVPLKLCIVSQEVSPEGKKKKVYVLQFEIPLTLAELKSYTMLPDAEDEMPELLYPGKEAEQAQREAEDSPEPAREGQGLTLAAAKAYQEDYRRVSAEAKAHQEGQGMPSGPQPALDPGPGASRPAPETTGRRTKATSARLEALWAEQTKLPNFAAIREDLARAWKARQERLELTGLMTEAQAQDWIADIEKEQKGK